jgi:hypothetical protein
VKAADRGGGVAEAGGRLQPLLLAAGVALVVPYLVGVGAPWPVLVVAVVLVLWGLLIVWQRRAGALDPHRSLRRSQLESVVAAVAYVLLVVVDGGRHPTATLLLAAGIVATVAILTPSWLRSIVQSVTVLAAGAAVGLAGSWLDGALVAALIGVVAVVSDAYAEERLAAIDRQGRARQDIDRRVQLLHAIARLPDDDEEVAARAVVATLRALTYDAAAVELVRGDRLEVVAIDGLSALPAPRGQGIGWQAILERRTVTTDRYPRTAWRLPGREGVHAGVATPILVDGRAVGCLVGLRIAAAAATEAEMEVAEVLAIHLGAVLRRLERERWHRAHVDQLARLRHLHAELAVALGAELRGPLVEFRQLGAALVAADADVQHALAERFSQRTEDVLRTVQTVLDVGRSQAVAGAPRRVDADVAELLAPVARATGAAVDLGPEAPAAHARQVHVVEPFVQRALELLLRSGSPSTSTGSPRDGAAGAAAAAPARLVVRRRSGHLVLAVERDVGAPTGVARALAARLLRSAGAELDADAGTGLVVRLPSAVAAGDPAAPSASASPPAAPSGSAPSGSAPSAPARSDRAARGGAATTDGPSPTDGLSPGSLQRRRRLGIALVAPVLLLIPYLQLRGVVREPWVVWPTIALVLLVCLPPLRLVWRGSLPHPSRTASRAWLGLGTMLGLGGLVALLSVGLLLEDVAVFAAVVAVLLVVEVQTFAGWQRWSLVGVTVGLWGTLLVHSGVSDPAVLLLHGAGALVLGVGTARIADDLAETTANAAAERRRAAQRATVLAEVLRARSPEPAEVKRAVLRGMDAVGFEVMAIRRVDTFAGRAVLEQHRTHLPFEVEVDARDDLGLLGVAIQERREVVVADVAADPRAIDRGEGLLGAIAVPLLDDGEVFAAIEGAVCSGPLDELQLDAVRQLAAVAQRSLVHARSLAQDRRSVRERERVQARTEAFVLASADGFGARMQALRADVQLLRSGTGELDGDQRAAAVRRISEHARRLASLVRSMIDDAAAVDSSLLLDARPVSLQPLVRAVMDRTLGHRAVVEVAPDLVVAADPALVERLIEELVLAVAADGTEASVRIGARRVGERIRLTVDGSAASSDDPDRMTEPAVVPVLAATVGPRPGWMPTVVPAAGDVEPTDALSLRIAEQLVRAHGGELSIRRRAGRALSLDCSLPAVS